MIGFQELKNPFRHLIVFDIASAQFVGDIDGHIARPTLSSIESDDADRMFILLVDQVSDQRRAASDLCWPEPPLLRLERPLSLA